MSTDLTPATAALLVPVAAPGIVLRGTPPARDEYELANRMRVTGLEPRALPATAAWLSSEKRSSPATRRGYSQDLSWWLAYLEVRGLDEMDVAPLEADLYGAALREAALAPATRERRISAASSWYRYLMRAGVAARNPFTDMERAQPPARFKTRGLSKAELDRMLAHAHAHAQAEAIAAAHELGRAAPSQVRDSARAYAMLCLFVVTACRVGGIIDAQLSSLGYDAGHRIIDLPAKGPQGTTLRAAIPPYAHAALERSPAYRLGQAFAQGETHAQQTIAGFCP
ncbi:site-specific integrase [Streptosporangium sp. LJ11]|uniref:tyrosine-type recombinase/integrase n=1 Tax=Streptosporangium sp. LJ11 TaxID=3436927 RepID=UPI003F7AF835